MARDVMVEMERSHGGQNRCDLCGRFRAWDGLGMYEYAHMDIAGGVDQSWAMECDDCHLDESVATGLVCP